MKTNFISVPFTAPGAHGFVESIGVAKFSRAGIVLEFEAKYFNFVKHGGVKEVRVGLNEILDIKFRRGIYQFLASIELRLKTVSTFAKLPNEDGKIKLKIKREDYARAEEAVEQTLRWLNEPKPEELLITESDKSNGQFLPPPTSVEDLIETKILESDND